MAQYAQQPPPRRTGPPSNTASNPLYRPWGDGRENLIAVGLEPACFDSSHNDIFIFHMTARSLEWKGTSAHTHPRSIESRWRGTTSRICECKNSFYWWLGSRLMDNVHFCLFWVNTPRRCLFTPRNTLSFKPDLALEFCFSVLFCYC